MSKRQNPQPFKQVRGGHECPKPGKAMGTLEKRHPKLMSRWVCYSLDFFPKRHLQIPKPCKTMGTLGKRHPHVASMSTTSRFWQSLMLLQLRHPMYCPV